ncbi:MAG: serine/threonine protein kinase, partial [Oscillospiraceae bacterium]
MNDHLCMGCMSEKGEEDVCSFCGYADGTPQFPSYLETGSIVDNRYLIGKVLFYNGESVTYIGYDVIAK